MCLVLKAVAHLGEEQLPLGTWKASQGSLKLLCFLYQVPLKTKHWFWDGVGRAERSEWRMFHNMCPLDKSRVTSKLRECHPLFKNHPPSSDFYKTRHRRNRSGICASEQRNICTEQETTLPVLVDCGAGHPSSMVSAGHGCGHPERQRPPWLPRFQATPGKSICRSIDHVSRSLHKNISSEKHLPINTEQFQNTKKKKKKRKGKYVSI